MALLDLLNLKWHGIFEVYVQCWYHWFLSFNDMISFRVMLFYPLTSSVHLTQGNSINFFLYIIQFGSKLLKNIWISFISQAKKNLLFLSFHIFSLVIFIRASESFRLFLSTFQFLNLILVCMSGVIIKAWSRITM